LLLGLWGTYWALLAAFMLGPLALAVYRATNAPQGQGSVNASFGTGGFSVTVVRQAQTIYSSSIHLLTAALWIAGPPILIWLAVAIGTRRTERPDPVST
jgi:hypothetical protein